MFVNIVFNEEERDWDIIDVPDVLANDIESIHQRFVDWVCSEANKGRFLVYADGIESHNYDIEDFLGWINDELTNEISEKAKIQCRNAGGEIDYNLPTIYF